KRVFAEEAPELGIEVPRLRVDQTGRVVVLVAGEAEAVAGLPTPSPTLTPRIPQSSRLHQAVLAHQGGDAAKAVEELELPLLGGRRGGVVEAQQAVGTVFVLLQGQARAVGDRQDRLLIP